MSDQGKRGRPKAEEPGNTVATWLRAGDHDRLIAIAHREEKTISALVRELVKLRISLSK